MKPRVNYLIATWSGSRHTPAKDYLKIHLKRLFELKHELDQITVIRPLGSDNDDFYDVGEEMLSKITIINRPANDRSYGQFIYAYQQYTDQFDYYIICEDDYCPNIDNFDSILVELIERSGCDYLCGKYAKQCASDRDRAIHNQGIVRSSAFKRMLEMCNPEFPPMGPADGTEQLIFSEYFTSNGMDIKDYSDKYPVPFWTKTLSYFSEKKSLDTIFVPYQCVSKDTPFHFLSTLQYCELRNPASKFVDQTTRYHNINEIIFNNGEWFVIEEPSILIYPIIDTSKQLGLFKLYRDSDNRLNIKCYVHPDYLDSEIDLIIFERISWENRSENLYLHIKKDCVSFDKLNNFNWIIVSEENNNVLMTKDYRNW